MKLLDVNARFMRSDVFAQLVANLERDGVLTSSPLAWWNGEKYEVLSGNHRVAAGMEAGIESAVFLVTHDDLTVEERIAIQLSHNSIEGEDDPAILKQLYEAIGAVDLKVYAGLDDSTLNLLADIKPVSISEAALHFANVSIVFLPEELAEAQEALAEAKKVISGSDEVWANRMSDYDAFLDSLDTASGALDVRNTATALMLIVRTFRAHAGDLDGILEERDEKDWIPMSAVFGHDRIPAALAQRLAKLATKAVDSGTVEHRWQILDSIH